MGAHVKVKDRQVKKVGYQFAADGHQNHFGPPVDWQCQRKRQWQWQWKRQRQRHISLQWMDIKTSLTLAPLLIGNVKEKDNDNDNDKDKDISVCSGQTSQPLWPPVDWLFSSRVSPEHTFAPDNQDLSFQVRINLPIFFSMAPTSQQASPARNLGDEQKRAENLMNTNNIWNHLHQQSVPPGHIQGVVSVSIRG